MTFEEACKELFATLGDHQIMVLATGADNRITARSMSVILHSGKFYFQTDKTFLKYQQIEKNPNAALCWNNLQIEGVCHSMGNAIKNGYTLFLDKFKEHYKSAYEKYAALENEVMIEVEPRLITAWCYRGSQPYRKYYDFQNKTYKTEDYL